MQVKTIAMMVAAGCAVTMLTGCGVPKEEHAATVAELNTAAAENVSLNEKIVDLESLLGAEKNKVKMTNIELKGAQESITEGKQREAEVASALADEKAKVLDLEGDVTSAQSATTSAREQVSTTEAALAILQEEYAELEARFNQFQRNLGALDGEPASDADAMAPGSSESALDILNGMSME